MSDDERDSVLLKVDNSEDYEGDVKKGELNCLLRFVNSDEEQDFLWSSLNRSQRTLQFLAAGMFLSIAVGFLGSSDFTMNAGTICLVVACVVAVLQLILSVFLFLDPVLVFILTTVCGGLVAYGAVLNSHGLEAVTTYLVALHVWNAGPQSGFPVINFFLIFLATELIAIVATVAFIVDMNEFLPQAFDSLGPPYSQLFGFTIIKFSLLIGTYYIQRSQRKGHRKMVDLRTDTLHADAIENIKLRQERKALRNEVYVKNMQMLGAPILKDDGPGVDLESPWTKAMAILAKLQKEDDLSSAVFNQIKDISILLASAQNIFQPDVEAALQKKSDEVDEETERYILELFDRNSSMPSISEEVVPGNNLSLPGTTIVKTVEDNYTQVLRTAMNRINEWDFDVFEVAKLTHGHPLLVISMALFKKYNLIDKFKISETKLTNFLKCIESGYQDMPYHNAQHGVDVTRAMHYFLWTGGLRKHMTDQELFAAITGSIIHDYDHPGTDNLYLVKSKESRALLYNDKSVLENHHAAQASILAMKEENNIFKNISSAEHSVVRKIIIDLVLATDLSTHGEVVQQFNTTVAGGNMDLSKDDNRRLALKMALKCGDLNHAAKPIALHKIWSMKVTEEFYRQGDMERSAGLEIGAFKDRATANLPKSQIGFMNFLVSPMYRGFMNWLDPEAKLPPLKHLDENFRHWKSQVK